MPNFHQVLADELNHEILNRPGRESGPAGAVKTADESAISSTAPATEATGTAPDVDGKRPIIGLAFSGGGIRSATFNLGVMQGLAKFKLLRQIDYLSTVSGGGFIGSWLITWIKPPVPKRFSKSSATTSRIPTRAQAASSRSPSRKRSIFFAITAII
jgi:hypothetical protein